MGGGGEMVLADPGAMSELLPPEAPPSPSMSMMSSSLSPTAPAPTPPPVVCPFCVREMCGRLAQDLVEHGAMLLGKLEELLAILPQLRLVGTQRCVGGAASRQRCVCGGVLHARLI